MKAFAVGLSREVLQSTTHYVGTALSAHVEQYSPEEIAQIAAYAVEVCSSLGIERRIDHCRWLNLMFTLGFEFHTDPAFPWVREILDDPQVHPDAIAPWLVQRATAARLHGDART